MRSLASESFSEIAATLRNEHKIVTDLVNKVSAATALVPAINRGDWLDNLKRHFSRLRVHINNHMAAEERDGFLTPVLELRPTLSFEVEHLRKEHAEIARWLDQIWNELVDIREDDDLLIGDTLHRIKHLISTVRHHEEREELLVSFVFSQDIGGHN